MTGQTSRWGGESKVLPLQSADKREQFYGKDVPVPHLHIYREGYGDKWAIPVPANRFRTTDNVWMSFEDFLQFCNITKPPDIDPGLFI